MQVLRITGLSDSGTQLVCQRVEKTAGTAEMAAFSADKDATFGDGDRFVIDIDDRLRAAIKGDLSRLRQLEIDMEPQLRPREIQNRIRAGATLEQVSAAAGSPVERIERFAYPVLMERAAMAQKAREIKPFAADLMGSAQAGRSDMTLEDIVATTLAERGHRTDIAWDAYKDERGWALCATWRIGRSDNHAEWTFQPRADGGAVTPRDDTAADLVDPSPRGLRTIDGEPTGAASATVTAITREGEAAPDGVTDTDVAANTGKPDASTSAGTAAETSPEKSVASTPASPKKSRRGQRPEMPSWEDVLLGTRAAER